MAVGIVARLNLGTANRLFRGDVLARVFHALQERPIRHGFDVEDQKCGRWRVGGYFDHDVGGNHDEPGAKISTAARSELPRTRLGMSKCVPILSSEMLSGVDARP